MENFKISWKNHENRQINSIAQLLFNDKFTDCTLAAEGKNIRAHKVILSSASTYFLVSIKIFFYLLILINEYFYSVS